jgi:hypothetical protein
MRRSTRLAAASVATALATLATACSHQQTNGSGGPATSGPRSGPASGGPTSTPTGDPGCPAQYADPDPNRPQITLTFDLSADLGTVTGTERVRFTPDMPVHELVFRLTANGPTAFPQGNGITVQQATADPAGARFRYERAGAANGSPGGVLVIPLGHEVPAGQQVTADVAFTLKLSTSGFERFGRQERLAWFGSGQPLFAWERGVGWHREALAKWIGESATSEAANIDLTVTAPAWATVVSSGVQDEPAGAGKDERRWHAVAATARDVSVAAGELTASSAKVGDTTITLGTTRGENADQTMQLLKRAVTELSARFGPFPFPALNVTLLPQQGGGIEYPGSILLFGSNTLVDTHETAHQWFYALVGDAQSRDPWLDEAFATYSEELVDHDEGQQGSGQPGKVGNGINDFPSSADYYGSVYGDGSAALHQARAAAGPAKFDAALRCYVKANAWRIARPSDLASALAHLPPALAVLHKAGALK